jgi:hypothetical protein
MGQKNLFLLVKKYSLEDIENDILRKMNEPRIHFAINCASVSCPELLNEAFTESKLKSNWFQLLEISLPINLKFHYT